MTLSQQDNFQPGNALERAASTLNAGLKAANRAIYDALPEPFQALQQMGDYRDDAVRDAWKELRDLYGTATMTYNLITDVVSTDCEDRWWVVVKTAIPAAGDALWLLLIPSPQEILENYLSPNPGGKGGKGGRGARDTERRESRNGKRRRRWPGIPDVDNLIADQLPGRDAVAGRNVGAGQRWLFASIEATDRALWYYLLVDVGKTFFTSWSSGMLEARFCSRPITHGLALIATSDLHKAGNLWTVDTDQIQIDIQKNMAQSEGNMSSDPQEPMLGSCDISASGKQTNNFNCVPDVTWKIRARLKFPDGTSEDRFGPEVRVKGDDAPVEMAISFDWGGADRVELEFVQTLHNFCPADLADYRMELLTLPSPKAG